MQSPTDLINYLWTRLGIHKWLLSAIVFYHRWLPLFYGPKQTRYVSDIFIVDDSDVTRVNADISALREMTDYAKTPIVFYYLDSKQYAIMINLAEFDFASNNVIPYDEKEVCEKLSYSEHDDYLSLDYEGRDVTEAFSMYLGPLKNSHSDKIYAISPRYSRMIDNRGNRLFRGTATTAVGILRSDFGTLQHIKISENVDQATA